MDKIWLKAYPPYVPSTVDPSKLRSLKQLLEETCAKHAARVAYIYMGATITYGELDELSRAFGAWLQGQGFRKGDRIAIMLPNSPQYPIAMFGALRAGLIVVNTNPLYTAPELEHQLIDAGVTAIVVLENFAHVVEKVLPHTTLKSVLVTAVGDFLSFPKSAIVNLVVRRVKKQVPAWRIPAATSFKSAVSAGRRLALAPVDLGPDDLAFLQYTGGTTGVAKGAMLSHGNVSTNVLQAEAWIGESLPNHGTLLTAIPLYHIFALSCNCMVFARLGWQNLLIINPRDLKSLIADMQRHPCNFISGVNTLFNAMLHAPGFDQIDFSGLKISLGGGMAVQATVAAKWKEATGNVLSQAWGLTETSPAACINPPSEEFNGSIGVPIPSTEVAIKDDAGNDLPLGQIGEICVRPAGDEGLLEPPGRDRQGDAAGRIPAHGRPRPHGQTRLRLHRGPQEGHDPGLGLQRLPERGRGRRRGAPRHPRGRRGRAARRALGRSGGALRSAQGPGAHGEGCY